MANFLKTVMTKVRDLTNLEIITAVGTCTEGAEGISPNIGGSQMMYSKIDLIDGDMTTVIDESFLKGERATLREFHMEREQQGRDIIRANIQTLGNLISLYKSLKKDFGQEPTEDDPAEA